MSTPRFKPVPEPPESLDGLSEARQAVPLVPDAQADCCARLQRQLELTSRQDAETWLTFLRALELVKRTQRGYARTRDDFDRDELATALRERVVGAETVLDAAAESAEENAAGAAFEAVREDVPEWERRRHDDWEAVWRDRTERLLGWVALFDADAAEA
ncbi:hypothetical protein SAMN06269185_1349 [Natronoarchaeum philippinense]|uniref:Uncharacterized protein n=1 Tax=Natronoarchaeum philippinense TaxID=558529 RepID=A0A285NBZ9_NATPI|nr:hypothetical protein [Natronoarchaeum philippinense]SNZ06970.1 hypothetical protein SAMN06269185_1349 [Natronoarchaeum philippinense]